MACRFCGAARGRLGLCDLTCTLCDITSRHYTLQDAMFASRSGRTSTPSSSVSVDGGARHAARPTAPRRCAHQAGMSPPIRWCTPVTATTPLALDTKVVNRPCGWGSHTPI